MELWIWKLWRSPGEKDMRSLSRHSGHHERAPLTFDRLSRHSHRRKEDLRNDNEAYIRMPSLAVSAVTNSIGTFVRSLMIVTAFGIKSIG